MKTYWLCKLVYPKLIDSYVFSHLVFDEDFVFEERPTIIGRRSIEILLYDFDAYSRHVCIGGTKIDLSQIDLSEKVSLWMPLLSCSEQVKLTNVNLRVWYLKLEFVRLE